MKKRIYPRLLSITIKCIAYSPLPFCHHQTAWIILLLLWLSSGPPTVEFAWNADCLDGAPCSSKESADGSMRPATTSRRLSLDMLARSSTLAGFFEWTGIGLRIWCVSFLSSPARGMLGGQNGYRTGTYAGMNAGTTGGSWLHAMVSSGSTGWSSKVDSIGSHPRSSARLKEGNRFISSVSAAEEGSPNCSSSTGWASDDWHWKITKIN